MGEERRGHDRESLVRADFSGAFSIEINGQPHVFTQVNDVSISGMGIILSQSVPAGTPIVLKFVSEEFDLAINARAAWSTPDEQGGYRVGVQFSTEDLDANVMFFMTLREYIDDFGEAF